MAAGSGTPGRNSAITLRELERDFGGERVLGPVTISLPAGATLAVQGPNGSGKSTLLRVLAGLLRPSGGEATVLGCPLPKDGWRLRGRIGYLGHEPLLYRDLTPRENLTLCARLHGLDAAESERRIASLLERVEMQHRADDAVRELSAGMVRRIAVCRAMLHEPALLLLDEPDVHLDADGRELVAPLIAGAAGRSRVVVTHDDAAAGRADQLLHLNADGTSASAEGADA